MNDVSGYLVAAVSPSQSIFIEFFGVKCGLLKQQLLAFYPFAISLSRSLDVYADGVHGFITVRAIVAVHRSLL